MVKKQMGNIAKIRHVFYLCCSHCPRIWRQACDYYFVFSMTVSLEKIKDFTHSKA